MLNSTFLATSVIEKLGGQAMDLYLAVQAAKKSALTTKKRVIHVLKRIGYGQIMTGNATVVYKFFKIPKKFKIERYYVRNAFQADAEVEICNIP